MCSPTLLQIRQDSAGHGTQKQAHIVAGAVHIAANGGVVVQGGQEGLCPLVFAHLQASRGVMTCHICAGMWRERKAASLGLLAFALSQHIHM